MPVSNITFEVSGDATPRRVVYTGEYGKGLTLTYGPVITTDPEYDPENELQNVETALNEQLAQREITEWLKDPTQAPIMIEASKEEYFAAVDEQQKEAIKVLAVEQAKVEQLTTANEAVNPIKGKLS